MLKRLVLSTVLVLAAAPAAAQADSLWYVQGGNIYAAHADGSGAEQLTTDGHNSWPSQADNGTFAFADTVDGHIYRAGADGNALNNMTTYGSYSSDKPNTVRLSPDGTKLAYRILYAGDYHVYWTPSDATDTRGFSQNGQSLGQESYGSPSWIGNTDLFLVHNGATFTNQDEFATYHVGNGDNTLANGGSEPDQSWQNGYRSAITRDGSKVASIQDDGAGSAPTRTELHLFTTNATVPTAVTLKCTITLPPQDTFYSSPSFSADGTRLAFALSDGVHILNVADLSSCPTTAGPVVVSGATMPYLGAANPPVLAPSGGGGGGSQGGGQPGGGSQGGGQQGGGGTADTTAPVPSLKYAKTKLATALAKGLAFSFSCNEACSGSLAVTLDAKTAKKLGLLGRKSKSKKPVKVGSGSIGMGSGTRSLKMKFTSAAKKKLKKAKSLKLGGTLVVTDGAGNHASYSVKVALKK